MIKLLNILKEILDDSFPDTVSPDKDLGAQQLKNYWTHAPRGKIKNIINDKGMYFQKGSIFWRKYFDYYEPQKYGEGQLILSNISDKDVTPTLADTSKVDLDSSKGVAVISGKFIRENPKYFQLYQYNPKTDLYEKSNISNIINLDTIFEIKLIKRKFRF